MSNTTQITLDYPVEVDGEKIDSLHMRHAKVRDQKLATKAAGGEAEQETTLFAHLCEVSPKVIEELDLADYRKLQQGFQDFLSRPKT